jgi:CheY-like chemotaxis protein
MANILWMDNDRTFTMPFAMRLELAGHTVVRAHTVQEAEQNLKLPKDGVWNLILIDIMMNAKQDETLGNRYSEEITRSGRRTGIVFYELNKAEIIRIGSAVGILSMRNDQEIMNKLESLEIPKNNIKHKMELADARDFGEWVDKLLARGGTNGNG